MAKGRTDKGDWPRLRLAHLVSISAAWMVLKRSSATPTPSTLIRWGWKRASGASNRSPPTLITRPSGSWGCVGGLRRREKRKMTPVKGLGLRNDARRLGRGRRCPPSVLMAFLRMKMLSANVVFGVSESQRGSENSDYKKAAFSQGWWEEVEPSHRRRVASQEMM